MTFVKSATTSTPVGNSRAELERMLTRYGCDSFSSQVDYATGRVVIGFLVPDDQTKDARRIPVKLEINTRTVYDALFGRPTKREWFEAAKRYDVVHNPAGYDPKKLAQAERVAWRQIVLWVDAALSAAAAGVQRISEAFMAHTLVRGDDGAVRRMVDHLDHASGGQWRSQLLLPSGDA